MKKKGFVWGLVLVLAVGLLSGCGSKSAASMPEETAVAEAPAESYSMDAAADYGTGNGSMMPAAEGSGETSSAVQGSKRIYTATLELETTGFDEAVSALTELVDGSGGWVSSSSVSNQSSSYRYADLTVRVPVEKYRDFLTQAGELCHLLYTQEYVDDVTEAYYATLGGRLAAAFTSGCRSFLTAAEDLLVALVYSWVWLVILAAAVIVVVRRLKKRGVRLPSLGRKDHASDHDAPKDGTL